MLESCFANVVHSMQYWPAYCEWNRHPVQERCKATVELLPKTTKRQQLRLIAYAIKREENKPHTQMCQRDLYPIKEISTKRCAKGTYIP